MLLFKPRNKYLANIEVNNIAELIKSINKMPLYSEIDDFVTEIKVEPYLHGKELLVSVKTDFVDKFNVVGYLIDEHNYLGQLSVKV